MKLTVLQSDFKNALSLSSHFITSKAQLPILSNFLLKAHKSRLVITATNLESSVSTSIGAKIEQEGETTVQGKVLFEIINNLRSGNINLEASDEYLKIGSVNFKSQVQGMNPSEFPQVPESNSNENLIKLKKEDLLKAISKTSFSVSTDDTRPVLTGISFKFSGKEVELAATDGFRLSKVNLPFSQKIEIERLIVPKAILLEICRFEKGDEIIVSYSKADNQVVFSLEETVFSSRLIEGTFPDYEKIIPKGSLYKITVDKEDMEQAIKLSGIFAREAGNVIKLNVKKEKITITAQSANSGSQETEVEAKVETEEKIPEDGVEISYNFRFIEEFLKSVEGESVTMELSGSNAAGKFLDPQKPNYLHLIMPIRTQG